MNGKTTDETEQVKIITDDFRNTFYDETTPMKHVPPKEMLDTFHTRGNQKGNDVTAKQQEHRNGQHGKIR